MNYAAVFTSGSIFGALGFMYLRVAFDVELKGSFYR